MTKPNPERQQIVRDTCAASPTASCKAIARHLFQKYPNHFKNLNAADLAVRRARGVQGKQNRRLSSNAPDARPAEGLPTREPTETAEFNGNQGVIATRTPEVNTLEQLLAYMKVDLSVWEVERHVINKWEVGGKPGDGNALIANSPSGFAVQPLFQVKAWLRRKVSEVKARNFLDGLLAQFKKSAPVRKAPKLKSSGVLMEIDIFDAHFGKLCWKAETGRDYDLKIARLEHDAAVEGLLARAKGFPIARFLYPIGNDFLHTDNDRNTTNAGTPQDVDGRWQKAFTEGRAALKNSIDRLRQIAPVDVMVIPGNHDPERMFYLGEVLQAWYHSTVGVTIENSPAKRKYYRYGANLIGLTHGDKEKHSELPLVMATERPQDWAATKFREFHLGHLHKLKTISFMPVQEFNAIRVRTLSSLTPPDAWHKMMGYEGLRAANAIMWDKADGCVATISYNAK